MRLIRFTLAWIITAVAVSFLAPAVSAFILSSPGPNVVGATGNAAGKLLPRGRWQGNGSPGLGFAVRTVTPDSSVGTGFAAWYDWAGCLFGGPTSPPALITFASAAAFPPAIWWIRRRRVPESTEGQRRGLGTLMVPVCGAIGLGAWMLELSVRIFWTAAESQLRERSIVHDTEGLFGGGSFVPHGNVLALTDLPLWLSRAGVWGLVLLAIVAIARWRTSRHRIIAIVWVAGCVMLLASPWWLAFVFGPLWID